MFLCQVIVAGLFLTLGICSETPTNPATQKVENEKTKEEVVVTKQEEIVTKPTIPPHDLRQSCFWQ
jgi:hypothetical protein